MLESELKRTGLRQGLKRVRSKSRPSVESKCFIAVIDSSELSGCMRIYPMPPVDQSILRKVGFELSYRRRRSEVITFILQLLKLQLAKGTKKVAVEFDDDTNVVDSEVVLCLIQIVGHNSYRMSKGN